MAISKQEHLQRKDTVLKEAFRLFAEHSIEAVSMQQIADAAGIGVASVFRYYAGKTDLVIAVSGYMWSSYLRIVETRRPVDTVRDIPAVERLKFALDLYLDIYRNHKDLLKFNDNFNHYITHENVAPERLRVYTDAVNPMRDRLHWMYEKGKVDKTIRTDIPEGEFLRVTVHSMMAACHLYAGGFIWGASEEKNCDYTRELILLKEMILKFACENVGTEGPGDLGR